MKVLRYQTDLCHEWVIMWICDWSTVGLAAHTCKKSVLRNDES